MNATIEKIETKTAGIVTDELLVKKIIGGEVVEDAATLDFRLALMAVHDCWADGLLESAERAAEGLVHQVRLLRLKQMANEAGIVAQGN